MSGASGDSVVVVKGATTETSSSVPTKDVAAVVTPPPPPPLVLAALRLEKILYDHNDSIHSSTLDSGTHYESYYMNPIKVVRRWLGTSSGATSKKDGKDITIQEIQMATRQLLDPITIGCIQKGRTLILELKLTDDLSKADVDTQMQTDDDDDDDDDKPADSNYVTIASAREIECWLFSLMIRALYKQHQFVPALTFANEALLISTSHYVNAGMDIATTGTSSSTGANSNSTNHTPPSIKSSMYPFTARLYRFAALAYESYMTTTTTAAAIPTLSSDMLSTMSKAHTLATVRRDVDTQATLLNIMLRELLRHSQVEQAQTLLSNTKFPDEMASNNQYCRYLYYSGRIYALRLEYTMAYANLSQCLRKLPQNTGIGFRICVQRLVIVVQLLMGEIPDRHVFNTPECRIELQPYLSITTAVRHGDLVVFEQVVTQHTQRLQLDGTYTLISRLAHQVVKAGLRKLHLSYSRLSLQDIATRLGLPSAKSAEYVVAKAVRDGVIDATIYHNEGYVESHDLIDVYATKEPAEAFHRRIAYCLTTHNDAVRGMRYPPDAYKKQLEASRGNRRKRNDDDNKTDEEKAKELEEEFDDDY